MLSGTKKHSAGLGMLAFKGSPCNGIPDPNPSLIFPRHGQVLDPLATFMTHEAWSWRFFKRAQALLLGTSTQSLITGGQTWHNKTGGAILRMTKKDRHVSSCPRLLSARLITYASCKLGFCGPTRFDAIRRCLGCFVVVGFWWVQPGKVRFGDSGPKQPHGGFVSDSVLHNSTPELR